jgi:sporulation protein YlmC with PRC-barrel domain
MPNDRPLAEWSSRDVLLNAWDNDSREYVDLSPNRAASRLQARSAGVAMAQRASELMGKAVVSADTGEKLGAVSDLLLDETDHHLIGLVVQRGMMKSEHVLPAAAVQTFGRDAVVSRTGQDLLSAKAWQRSVIR